MYSIDWLGTLTSQFSDPALEGVVDFLGKVLRHHVRFPIGLNIQDLVPEVLLDRDDLGLPSFILFPNNLLGVFDQRNEASVRRLVRRRRVQNVVLDTCLWIHSDVGFVADASLLIAVEYDDEAWLDLQRLQEVDLGSRVREALHDPTIDLAITLFDPRLNQRVQNIVRDELTRVQTLGDDLSDLWAPLDLILQQCAGRDVNQAEALGDGLGLGVPPGARRTNQDYSWRPPWRVLSEPEIQHPHQIRDHIVVRLVRHIMLKYELAERLLDALHVELVLLEALRRQVLQVRPVQLLVDGEQIVLQS